MADLKPCPFCGRIPVVEDCGENRYFVRCKCGIAQDKLYWQRCDAVRRWNTRKVKQLPSAQQEAKHPKWIAEDRYVKNNFVLYPHCPQCNEEITTGDCYCRICGQHIDWSEDDE